ncbi:MAG: hypothetical protein V7782_01640 [Psychromonas sp.]
MSNIHSINGLPSQSAIDLIASYRAEFEKTTYDYALLLSKLKQDILKLEFMCQQDNQIWMMRRGRDYLDNPKLFNHAPLTYICVFLGEIFKEEDLNELEEKLTPEILENALIRLYEFKLH